MRTTSVICVEFSCVCIGFVIYFRIHHIFGVYVSFIRLRLTKTSLTLINRTRLRTKGQSAGYPQAQIEVTSNSSHRQAL